MERKCKTVGSHDIKKVELELWAKKEGQPAQSLVFCEAGPVLLRGGSARFLKNGVENSLTLK